MRAIGSEHMDRSYGTHFYFTTPDNGLKSVVTKRIVPPELLYDQL